jgi:hypothetical protein
VPDDWIVNIIDCFGGHNMGVFGMVMATLHSSPLRGTCVSQLLPAAPCATLHMWETEAEWLRYWPPSSCLTLFRRGLL